MNDATPARWPPGGGEMARRIRAHDWAATPLGPIAGWPAGLRVAVRLLLGSRHPMFIWWGPELVQLYNDAYRETMGPEKHPSALGTSGRETWAEIWDTIGPQIEQVMTGGAATWHEDQLVPVTRHGGLQEVWWTYSFSPIDDERAPGGVGGVLVICRDVTREHLAGQALRESEARQAFLLGLSDALRPLADPVEIQRTATRMLGEHLKASRVFYVVVEGDGDTAAILGDYTDGVPSRVGRYSLSAFSSNAVDEWRAGRIASSGDVNADPRYSEAERKAYASVSTRAGFGVPLIKEGRLVALLGVNQSSPRRWTGYDHDLAGEVAERTWAAVERARAEAALRESQQRLQRVLETDAVAVLFFGRDGILTDANDVFLRMSGYSREDVEAGQLTWQQMTAPEWLAVSQEQMDQFLAEGRIGPYEKEYLRKDGTRAWMLFAGRDLGDGTIVELGVNIDDRKRAEAALRASEARLAAVFEVLPVGVGVFDAHRTLILSNQEMQRFIPTRIIPSWDEARRSRWCTWRPDGRLVEPEDYPGARALRDEHVVPGIEMLYTDDDGREIWTSVSAVPLKDEEGRVTGTAVVVADIDPLKRGAEALRASEERFRGFAENSADVLWIADGSGERLEYLSPAFDRMFGVPRGWLMADLRRWRELVHPEDREAASGFMPRVLAGETAIAHYRAIRPADGRTVHLRDTGFPIRDASGAIVRVAGIVQDITDMERASAALREEKERFRTLAEGIPQLVWRSCREGLWTWASPQWLDYTGQSQEQSHGRGWLDAVHPDDREATMRAWAEARLHGGLDVEYRVRRAADGAWRWHQTRSAPVRGVPEPGRPEGRILEWLGTTSDIEDLKRLQGQQEVLVAELQHRTRNLLGVVRGIARRSFGPSPDRDEYDARLAAIGRVQGFLSRAPTWSVPLADLVAAELKATGDGASATVTVGGPPVELPGDKVQPVALALHELATNAAKHGALAQASGRLSVRWRVEGDDGAGRLVLDWRESGVEMPNGGRPTRQGYGSELIERALPYQLDAETRLEFASDGVRCTITLPIGTFEAGRKQA